MNRWKKIVSAVVVLAVAVVAAGVAIITSLDFNEYRGLIAERVKAATGRELTIRGDLQLELSLNPAVAVEAVTFANATWGSRAEMMKLERLAAEVELLPLLTGDVRVKRLVLGGLDLLVETDAKGRGNWLLEGAEKTPAPAEPGAGGGPSRLPVVHAVRIEDVNVTYRDGQTGRERTVRLASLSVRSDGLDAPMTIALAGDFDGKAIKASGQIGPLRTLLQEDAPYAISLDISALGATVEAEGTAARPREVRGLDLRIEVKGRELKDILAAVQDQVPALKGVTLPAIGPFRIAAVVKGGREALSLTGIDAAVGAPERLSVAVKGDVADALAGKGLNVRLNVEGRDIASVVRAAGVEVPAIPPFKAAAVVSDVKGGFLLDGLDAWVGGSDLKGRVAATLTGVTRPTVDARLTAELIDLDKLLPAGPARPETKGGRDRVFPADPLPTDGLRAIDAKLRLTADRLIIGGIAMNDVDVTLALGGGRLDIKPIEADIGGGRVRGSLVLDGSRPTPGLSVN
ncbi:MAG: AsmA family protein, partial [Rhodospirillales bacterium]